MRLWRRALVAVRIPRHPEPKRHNETREPLSEGSRTTKSKVLKPATGLASLPSANASCGGSARRTRLATSSAVALQLTAHRAVSCNAPPSNPVSIPFNTKPPHAFACGVVWSRRRDLNPRPLGPSSGMGYAFKLFPQTKRAFFFAMPSSSHKNTASFYGSPLFSWFGPKEVACMHFHTNKKGSHKTALFVGRGDGI